MRSLGIAGIAVVLACMAAALTLLPGAARPVRPPPRRRRSPPSDHGWFARLARLDPAARRRSSSCVVSLCLLAARRPVPQRPVRQPRRASRCPKSSETRQVAEAIDARFPGVTQEPVWIVADVDARRRRGRRRSSTTCAALDGVRAADDQRHLARRTSPRSRSRPRARRTARSRERVVSEVRGARRAVPLPGRRRPGRDRRLPPRRSRRGSRGRSRSSSSRRSCCCS